MNAITLIQTLQFTEGKTDDPVLNAKLVLKALKRMKKTAGMNNYIVRSAIRKQKRFIKDITK